MLIEVAYGRMAPEELESQIETAAPGGENVDYDPSADPDPFNDGSGERGSLFDGENDEKNPYQNF